MANTGNDLMIPTTSIDSLSGIYESLIRFYAAQFVAAGDVRPDVDTTNFCSFTMPIQTINFNTTASQWIYNDVDKAAQDSVLLLVGIITQIVSGLPVDLDTMFDHNDVVMLRHSNVTATATTNRNESRITLNGSVDLHIGFRYGEYVWDAGDNDSNFNLRKVLTKSNWRAGTPRTLGKIKRKVYKKLGKTIT